MKISTSTVVKSKKIRLHYILHLCYSDGITPCNKICSILLLISYAFQISKPQIVVREEMESNKKTQTT